MSGDPLSDLLLDEKEVNRELIARVLKGVIGVDTKTGAIVLKSKFGKLNAQDKVLIFLLGRKAAYLLEKSDKEEIEPKELPQATGMPSGTVHPKLRELLDQRLISQDDDGKYFIPNHQIESVISLIQKGLSNE